ncbi:MAG TPA: xanthine dehydrogenase family protein subunit M [Kofleriaceae bacterium]|nr:xanthine dehydrogenase family protein subunit M [Kofleriaceae bacterium]
MRPFSYVRARTVEQAVSAASPTGAQFVAGGTTLVDLMRLEVMRPPVLVDITALPLDAVEAHGDGVRVGAMARNSDVAHHPLIERRFPALAQALRSGASPQVRNMATVGGNLLQRTRCPYFRDLATACNKREPGAGCAAIGGYTRSHAVLGTSDHCIATHPSDMAVALVALDAVIHVRSVTGSRAIAAADFHTAPGGRPDVETVLRPGELITHVDLPASPMAARSRYVKVRDRASFAFALASAAVAVELRDGAIASARVALGGVATRPWRSREAEQALVGQPVGPETFRRAADAALAAARPQRDNRFKVELARRTLVRALGLATGSDRVARGGAP